MRLVAASWEGAGDLDEASGERVRLVHAADEEQGLAQLGKHERMEGHGAPGSHALQRLVQAGEGSRSTPGKGIRRTQGRQLSGGKRPGGLRPDRRPWPVRDGGVPCTDRLGGGSVDQSPTRQSSG